MIRLMHECMADRVVMRPAPEWRGPYQKDIGSGTRKHDAVAGVPAESSRCVFGSWPQETVLSWALCRVVGVDSAGHTKGTACGRSVACHSEPQYKERLLSTVGFSTSTFSLARQNGCFAHLWCCRFAFLFILIRHGYLTWFLVCVHLDRGLGVGTYSCAM